MARLLVKLRGVELSRITLERGVEYIAGRAQEAQIQLADERGISRQHLKFCERDGAWVCESLSRFALIHRGGETCEVLRLDESCSFSVLPYEFHFEVTADAQTGVENPRAQTNSLPTAFTAVPTDANHEFSDLGTAEGDTPQPHGNHEATMAGAVSHLVPYLRVSLPPSIHEDLLKLEGHLWVAGREVNCEIHIESSQISRKHFELVRTREGFFICDLGSSNGTKVNGRMIVPNEQTRLSSGDTIVIKNITMTFEIRDTSFAQRLESLPVPAVQTEPQPESHPSRQGLEPYAHHPHLPTYMDELPPLLSQKYLAKKFLVRALLVSLILIVATVSMLPNTAKPPTERVPAANGNTSQSFDKLTLEQRSAIKDAFSLAKNLYTQGKYELCLAELAKVEELVPQYETSKELRGFCEQGRELVKRQHDLERKERERAMIEQQINGVVENCKITLKESGNIDEIRQCLAPAMELDPEHHLIVEMIHTAQMRAEELKFIDTQRQALNAKTRAGHNHYNKAHQLAKSGKLGPAVSEFERFINTPYPQTEELKGTAKREITSLKTQLKVKVNSLLDQCKSLAGKNQYKDAYRTCDKALAEDGSNDVAKEMRRQMLMKLKRELKGIYEDSILEESMGNVDTAKEKWKLLVKDDLKDGEYAQKARLKLQKYGDGT